MNYYVYYFNLLLIIILIYIQILFSTSITPYKQISLSSVESQSGQENNVLNSFQLMLLMHFHITNYYFNRYFQQAVSIINSKAPMIEDLRQAFEIKVTTWTRDLKGLFDYDASPQQLRVSKFHAKNHCKIYRDSIINQNYFLAPHTKLINSNARLIGKIELQQNNQGNFFCLKVQPKTNNQTEENPNNSPYLVLKPNIENLQQYDGYPLKLGDKIRIGQIQYIIIELKTDYNNFQTLQETQGLIVNPEEKNRNINLGVDEQIGQKTNVKRRKRRTDKNLGQDDQETTRKTLKNKKIKKQQSGIKKETMRSKKASVQRDSQQELDIGKQRDLQNQQIQDEQKTIKFCSFRKKDKHQIRKIKQYEEQKSCKICLHNQESKQDPFISACFCKGSCSLTHLTCLKSWINSQTQVQNRKGLKIYHLKRSSCQICKCPFPKFINIKKQKFNLLDLELPSNSYIILQATEPQNLNKEDKKYIVIDGEKNPFVRIGRHSDSEIRIKDITVSRKHAQIIFKNNQFYILDHSKFGTLLKIQKDLKFGDEEINVQVGRCVYSIKPLFGKPALEIPNQSDNE